ncbi:hypothetical protein [Psychrobacter lutiphocae]|uniref:hypothetical protein n=1 Tax=Psychrobacter lutiphocae TaxID=540500 RepID=UPI0003691E0B|nr:hypothetical protein [Psychrobacter lutiphocae]
MKFNKSTLSLLSVITLSLSTIGCSDNTSIDTNDDDIQVIDESAEVMNGQEVNEADSVEASEMSNSGFDPSLYQDVNKEADSNYLIYLALAQHPEEMFDEKRLNVAYPEYLNEQDPQKKDAMAEQLKPQLHAEMAKYEQPYRVKINLIPGHKRYDYEQEQAKKGLMGENIVLDGRILGRYDFETKSFPISVNVAGSDDNPCWFPFWAADFAVQKHDINIVPNEACSLEVQDIAVAEDISKRNVSAKGIGYYRFEDRIAYPERVDLTFFDLDTGEDLATKTFTWSY